MRHLLYSTSRDLFTRRNGGSRLILNFHRQISGGRPDLDDSREQLLTEAELLAHVDPDELQDNPDFDQAAASAELEELLAMDLSAEELRNLPREVREMIAMRSRMATPDGATSGPSAQAMHENFWRSLQQDERKRRLEQLRKARADLVFRHTSRGKSRLDRMLSRWEHDEVEADEDGDHEEEEEEEEEEESLDEDGVDEHRVESMHLRHNLSFRGRARRSNGHLVPMRARMVVLPPALRARLSQLVRRMDRGQVRLEANRLSAVLRARTRQKAGQQVSPTGPVQPVDYSLTTAVAYATYRLPAVYACTSRVLSELAWRHPSFRPRDVLDFGSGPGTTLWAAKETFPSIEGAVAVEPSEGMESVSRALLGPALPVTYVQRLPADPEQRSDLVIASYVFTELPSDEERESVLMRLWAHVRHGGYLVLVDAGTPVGFEVLLQARTSLLTRDPARAAVDAPCPHVHRCPLPTSSFCHFSQRLQRPPVTMLSKSGAKLGYEDEKFSYMVFRKGQARILRSAEDIDPHTGHAVDSTQRDEWRLLAEPAADTDAEGIEWERLIAPPQKRGGHVVMTTCAPDGLSHTHVVTRAMGAPIYKDARKATWGDGFYFPSDLTRKTLERRHWKLPFRKEPRRNRSLRDAAAPDDPFGDPAE